MTDDVTGERTVWDALGDRLDAGYPRSWRPGYKGTKKDPVENVDGDTIMGTFVQEEEGQTAGYGSAKVLVIAEAETGELRSVWCFHEALRNQIERAALRPGDAVAIRQLGLRQSAAGQEYMDYRVTFSRWGSPVPPGPAIGGPQMSDSPPVDTAGE